MKSGNRERKRMLLFIYIIIYGMIKYFDGCYYSAEVKYMDLIYGKFPKVHLWEYKVFLKYQVNSVIW